MKLPPLFILIACLSIKCNSQDQAQSKVLNIPDSVAVSANNGQTQLYGTHIFLIQPEGFIFNNATNRLELNEATYIKAVETPTASYADKYNRFTELIKEENAKGFKTYFQKEFILQNKKAIILYGIDNSHASEQMILLFGDMVGSTMLLSRFAPGDNKSKNEILKSFLSAYKSDSSALNISSIQRFTIDMLDTKFKYNSTTLQMFFYTLNGLGDPGENNDEIIVGQTGPIEKELMKERIHSLVEVYRSRGMEITSYKEDSNIIGNQPAFSITITGKVNDQKAVIYGLAFGNSNSTISYQGIAYHNHEAYLEQFKRIARTLRLK